MILRFTGESTADFAHFVCDRLGQANLATLQQLPAKERIRKLADYFEVLTRAGYFSQRLDYMLATARLSIELECGLSAIASQSILAMDTFRLCELVFELAQDARYDTCDLYLNKKYRIQEASSSSTGLLSWLTRFFQFVTTRK